MADIAMLLAAMQLEDAESCNSAPKLKRMPETPAPMDCMLLEFENGRSTSSTKSTVTSLKAPFDEINFGSSAPNSALTSVGSNDTPSGSGSGAKSSEASPPALHLPPHIKGCLEELQKESSLLVSKFKAKCDRIEASYISRIQPLCAERLSILDRKRKIFEEKGFPPFWVTGMKEVLEKFSAEMTDLDEKALGYLKDIKYTALEKPRGWRLEFFFDPNPFFKNEVLQRETRFVMFRGQRFFKELKGTGIEWFPGKCLTQRTVKRMNKDYMVKVRSFFNLFMDSKYYADNVRELWAHIRMCEDMIKALVPHPLQFFLAYISRHYEVPSWCGKNSFLDYRPDDILGSSSDQDTLSKCG